jgi:hypothetical protein
VIESEKIIAAILAAVSASKDARVVKPEDYVRQYHEMLEELQRHGDSAGFSERLDAAIAKHEGKKI